MTKSRERIVKTSQVFLNKKDLKPSTRVLFYDVKTNEVFCIKRGNRQYLRASKYKRPLRRKGGTIRTLRWWPSSKKRASKYHPDLGEVSRVDNPYTGKTITMEF